MKIDIYRLRMDRCELEAHIRSLKSVLRQRWTKPMASEQRELLALKWRVTQLCVLRAHLRGRLHLPDAERCREISEALMPKYREDEAA